MNKKLIATLVMSSVVASVFAVNAGAAADKKVLKDETGVVHNVTGKLGTVSGATAEARAFAALEKVKGDFGFATAAGNFKLKSSHKDENGTAHTKMTQVINGIPVFGSEAIVHEKNGAVSGVTGSFLTLKADAAEASITEAAAIETALNGATPDAAPTVELAYLPEAGNATLTYVVSYSVTFADTPGRYDVFVSAVNGEIVKSVNKLETAGPAPSGTAAVGTGKGVLGDTKTVNSKLLSGVYYLENLTKPMTGIIRTRDMKNGTSSIYNMTDADNNWSATNQAAAVDAHYYAGVTYDWYKNKVNRNSIDDRGMSLESLVHYGVNYNNAFWNGTYMVYGDGDGTTFRAFSAGLDVIAHELTHGVTEKTSALVYQDQSGALNESWSDAMGAVIEGNNWLMGEDLYIGNGAIRDMANPPAYGDPEHMSQYVNTTADNGGVHTNSGIPNKAFYNFATAIGSREIAGKIWYTANRDYMTRNTTFSQARAATLSAASALYGTTYTAALQNAWSAVGVY